MTEIVHLNVFIQLCNLLDGKIFWAQLPGDENVMLKIIFLPKSSNTILQYIQYTWLPLLHP